MNGMEMMLKSMGFDPSNIQHQVEKITESVMVEVMEIKATQQRIETKLDKLIENQHVLDRGLILDEFDPTKESGNVDSMQHQ